MVDTITSIGIDEVKMLPTGESECAMLVSFSVAGAFAVGGAKTPKEISDTCLTAELVYSTTTYEANQSSYNSENSRQIKRVPLKRDMFGEAAGSKSFVRVEGIGYQTFDANGQKNSEDEGVNKESYVCMIQLTKSDGAQEQSAQSVAAEVTRLPPIPDICVYSETQNAVCMCVKNFAGKVKTGANQGNYKAGFFEGSTAANVKRIRFMTGGASYDYAATNGGTAMANAGDPTEAQVGTYLTANADEAAGGTGLASVKKVDSTGVDSVDYVFNDIVNEYEFKNYEVDLTTAAANVYSDRDTAATAGGIYEDSAGVYEGFVYFKEKYFPQSGVDDPTLLVRRLMLNKAEAYGKLNLVEIAVSVSDAAGTFGQFSSSRQVAGDNKPTAMTSLMFGSGPVGGVGTNTNSGKHSIHIDATSPAGTAGKTHGVKILYNLLRNLTDNTNASYNTAAANAITGAKGGGRTNSGGRKGDGSAHQARRGGGFRFDQGVAFSDVINAYNTAGNFSASAEYTAQNYAGALENAAGWSVVDLDKTLVNGVKNGAGNAYTTEPLFGLPAETIDYVPSGYDLEVEDSLGAVIGDTIVMCLVAYEVAADDSGSVYSGLGTTANFGIAVVSTELPASGAPTAAVHKRSREQRPTSFQITLAAPSDTRTSNEVAKGVTTKQKLHGGAYEQVLTGVDVFSSADAFLYHIASDNAAIVSMDNDTGETTINLDNTKIPTLADGDTTNLKFIFTSTSAPSINEGTGVGEGNGDAGTANIMVRSTALTNAIAVTPYSPSDAFTEFSATAITDNAIVNKRAKGQARFAFKTPAGWENGKGDDGAAQGTTMNVKLGTLIGDDVVSYTTLVANRQTNQNGIQTWQFDGVTRSEGNAYTYKISYAENEYYNLSDKAGSAGAAKRVHAKTADPPDEADGASNNVNQTAESAAVTTKRRMGKATSVTVNNTKQERFELEIGFTEPSNVAAVDNVHEGILAYGGSGCTGYVLAIRPIEEGAALDQEVIVSTTITDYAAGSFSPGTAHTIDINLVAAGILGDKIGREYEVCVIGVNGYLAYDAADLTKRDAKYSIGQASSLANGETDADAAGEWTTAIKGRVAGAVLKCNFATFQSNEIGHTGCTFQEPVASTSAEYAALGTNKHSVFGHTDIWTHMYVLFKTKNDGTDGNPLGLWDTDNAAGGVTSHDKTDLAERSALWTGSMAGNKILIAKTAVTEVTGSSANGGGIYTIDITEVPGGANLANNTSYAGSVFLFNYDSMIDDAGDPFNAAWLSRQQFSDENYFTTSASAANESLRHGAVTATTNRTNASLGLLDVMFTFDQAMIPVANVGSAGAGLVSLYPIILQAKILAADYTGVTADGEWSTIMTLTYNETTQTGTLKTLADARVLAIDAVGDNGLTYGSGSNLHSFEDVDENATTLNATDAVASTALTLGHFTEGYSYQIRAGIQVAPEGGVTNAVVDSAAIYWTAAAVGATDIFTLTGVSAITRMKRTEDTDGVGNTTLKVTIDSKGAAVTGLFMVRHGKASTRGLGADNRSFDAGAGATYINMLAEFNAAYVTNKTNAQTPVNWATQPVEVTKIINTAPYALATDNYYVFLCTESNVAARVFGEAALTAAGTAGITGTDLNA